MKSINVLHILPELREGGVENHVLHLSRGLHQRGHRVGVVSWGGRLVERLHPSVGHHKLSVHRKNVFTGFWAASRIARLARREGWDLLHAHSRVPFWIAWWASTIGDLPWVATAHARYSKNLGIYPLRKARGVIAISETVESHLDSFLPSRRKVIYNGIFSRHELESIKGSWKGPENSDLVEFLFAGRLSRIKGLQVVLRALEGLGDFPWILHVLGEGALKTELIEEVHRKGWESRVLFHGHREDVLEWMKRSSCLLFPSLEEGMGLTLMEALGVGMPFVASRIPGVKEILPNYPLVPPGDVEAWKGALRDYLHSSSARMAFRAPSCSLPSKESMLQRTEEFYEDILDSPHLS